MPDNVGDVCGAVFFIHFCPCSEVVEHPVVVDSILEAHNHSVTLSEIPGLVTRHL